MGKAQIGAGAVEIILDGKPFYLVPSLGACTEISAMAGGLGGAIERCQRLHFETICEIVGAGIEMNGQRLNPRQRQDRLPKSIYEAGIIDVAGRCVEFVHIVANGGRPLPEDDEELDEDEGDGADDADGPLGSAIETTTG